MRGFCLYLCVLMVTTLAVADTIQYSGIANCSNNMGGGPQCGANCIVTGSNTITAFSSAPIVGTFIDSYAAFCLWVRVVDVTQNWTSSWALESTDTKGTRVTFGSATGGDVLRVEICAEQLQNPQGPCPNSGAYLYSSDPNDPLSADRIGHAKVNPNSPICASTANAIPSWKFWMEDLGAAQQSDWDYNDENLIISNVSVNGGVCPTVVRSESNHLSEAATPEPASCLLVASGLIGVFTKSRTWTQGLK
jgi:hypothetical protein